MSSTYRVGDVVFNDFFEAVQSAARLSLQGMAAVVYRVTDGEVVAIIRSRK